MLSLYQFPISHYCEKVRWALEYKNIEYKKINLLPGLHTRKAKKLTSNSSLPIVTHNKDIINESSEIISYLDQTFPENKLTPNNQKLNQEAKQWEQFADEELGADVRRICYHTLLNHPDIICPYFTNDGPWYGNLYMKTTFPKLSQTMRKLMKLDDSTIIHINQRLTKKIEKTYTHIKNREYFVGDSFTRADLAMAALLAPLCRTKNYGIDWPEQYPEPLHSTIAAYGNKLDWVTRMYNQHR
ncbi:MAG: glutathione S-transferase family protein [Gammaproteobacteria bacterium]